MDVDIAGGRGASVDVLLEGYKGPPRRAGGAAHGARGRQVLDTVTDKGMHDAGVDAAVLDTTTDTGVHDAGADAAVLDTATGGDDEAKTPVLSTDEDDDDNAGAEEKFDIPRGQGSFPLATVVLVGNVPRLLVDCMARAGLHVEERLHGSADVGAEATQRDMEQLALSPGVVMFYAVLSCMTAARARDRRLPERLRAQGHVDMPKLRSDDFPEVLPDLVERCPRDVLRVKRENAEADFLGALSVVLTQKGVPWCIENPRRSYLWACGLDAAAGTQGVGHADFDLCMVGGDRNKPLRLACYPAEAFGKLDRQCDGGHAHGSFSRAGPPRAPLAYPRKLCDTIVEIAVGIANQKGYEVTSGDLRPPTTRRTADDSVSAGTQARGDGHSQLVPEYHSVARVVVDAESAEQLRARIGEKLEKDEDVHETLLRKGSKLLRVVERGGGEGLDLPSRACFASWDGVLGGSALYIGRRHRTSTGRIFPASEFANPFKLPKNATPSDRATCLDKYASFLRARRDYPQCLRSLAGRVLVCHCREDEACHADVLITAFGDEFRSGGGFVAHVGVPWSVEEFTRLALVAEHPSGEIVLPDALKRAVVDRFTRGIKETIARREAYATMWERRAAELEDEEARVHRRMHPDVRRAMEGKRLLLFEEMLVEAGFPKAPLLVKRMTEGFRVIGDVEATDVYEPTAAQQKLARSELERHATTAQELLLATMGPAGDVEIDEALAKTTQEELQSGWLRGPFTKEDLDRKFTSWVPVKRFGIRQGQKVRAIDDYSLLGQNAAMSVAEKVDLTGVDFVATCARAFVAAAAGGDKIGLELSDGEVYGGHVHADFAGRRLELVGKTFDLKSAYRQLARHPDDAPFTVVAIWNAVEKRVEFFEQTVLAFGASSSFANFCHVARAIWTIMMHGLGVATGQYVDDYPVVEVAALARHLQEALVRMFGILGWDTKQSGDFAAEFGALGLVFDLSGTGDGEFCVKNSAGRVQELTARIDEIVQARRITKAEARALRGRLHHARGQTFGRCGAPAFLLLGEVADGKMNAEVVGRAIEALAWFRSFLLAAVPRSIRGVMDRPAVLFVDGCCELEAELPFVGIGAVLFLPGRRGPLYFGAKLGVSILERWGSDDKKQLVGQAELLPVPVAKATWACHLRGLGLLCFVDNNSARFGLGEGVQSDCSVSGAHRCLLLGRRAVVLARVVHARSLAVEPRRWAVEASVRRGGELAGCGQDGTRRTRWVWLEPGSGRWTRPARGVGGVGRPRWKNAHRLGRWRRLSLFAHLAALSCVLRRASRRAFGEGKRWRFLLRIWRRWRCSLNTLGSTPSSLLDRAFRECDDHRTVLLWSVCVHEL